MKDAINPAHYKEAYPFEVIEMIRSVLSEEAFHGYCLGNEIKYRMRAGIKDEAKVEEDIGKAEWYRAARKGGHAWLTTNTAV